MTKTELIDKIAAETGLTKKDAGKAFGAAVSAITAAMAGGEKVAVPGFGTFEVRERKARTGKNPRTGEAVKIAACKVPAFKAGKALKEAVNVKKSSRKKK